MGGVESLGTSKVSQTLLAMLMESQIWHQLAGSVGGGFRKGIMASACLDARHFIFSLYATGAFEAATPDLELRRGESVGGVFKRNYLVSQKLWGLIFLVLEPWAGGPGVGLGLLVPEIALLNFYPCGCRTILFHVYAPFYQSGWMWFL